MAGAINTKGQRQPRQKGELESSQEDGKKLFGTLMRKSRRPKVSWKDGKRVSSQGRSGGTGLGREGLSATVSQSGCLEFQGHKDQNHPGGNF